MARKLTLFLFTILAIVGALNPLSPAQSVVLADPAHELSARVGSLGAGFASDAHGENITPEFRLNASPNTISIVQGTSANVTITSSITGGFDASVDLSVSGEPTGVAATLSPSDFPAPGSGTSTLTFAVSSTAAPGTYTITVTGVGGGLTETDKVTLKITPEAVFTLSASPKTITVPLGGSATSTITSTVVDGFNAPVTLSVQRSTPATFSPMQIPAPGSGTSTMTVTPHTNNSVGTHIVTITGTGGGETHTIDVTLIITE